MSLLSQKQIKTSLSFYCEAQQKTVSLLTDMFVSKFLKVDILQASFFFFFVKWHLFAVRGIFSDELVPHRLKSCIYLVLILRIVKEPAEANLGAPCFPRGSNPSGLFFFFFSFFTCASLVTMGGQLTWHC